MSAILPTEEDSTADGGGNESDFGDFLTDVSDVEDLEEITEPWSDYNTEETNRPFYPVFIGEVIQARYQIEHKIGFGGFSTVWMAHDLQDKKDVAVQFLRSGEGSEREIRKHDQIRHLVQDQSHLVTYINTFEIVAPQGHRHRILVLPLKGPCMTFKAMQGMPVASRMFAAKQLLMALEALHKADIVHRDLNDGNCMWGMAPTHDLSREAKYEALGRPRKTPIRFVNLPKRGDLVYEMKVPESHRTEDFYLGDFGHATVLGESEMQPGDPPWEFCSPDRLHGMHPTFACDMWSYMTLFAMLYVGHRFFPTWCTGGIISGYLMYFGPLPEDWKGRYLPRGGARDDWYDQSEKSSVTDGLDARLAYSRPEVDTEERELVKTIMLKVFHYRPQERPTATQLLQDADFNALMARYGV
ncbi:kinase-like domain-containing protein [Aspergillus karnatakaensis]|uniref:protein kinase family protein n=1 Tax=Aspergillus karnatakaensis TaxID=1810916 RepID=UPI003CCD3637